MAPEWTPTIGKDVPKHVCTAPERCSLAGPTPLYPKEESR